MTGSARGLPLAPKPFSCKNSYFHAFGNGAELRRSPGTAIIAGLITSQFLILVTTLFVDPPQTAWAHAGGIPEKIPLENPA